MSPITNPFRIRTSEKQASNFFRICTSKTQHLKPFRIRTYKKRGVGVGPFGEHTPQEGFLSPVARVAPGFWDSAALERTVPWSN